MKETDILMLSDYSGQGTFVLGDCFNVCRFVTKNMENTHETEPALLVERLSILEYEIRKSITVREDQEETAETAHLEEARRYGIVVEESATKGDLLNAVQTAVRSARAKAGH